MPQVAGEPRAHSPSRSLARAAPEGAPGAPRRHTPGSAAGPGTVVRPRPDPGGARRAARRDRAVSESSPRSSVTHHRRACITAGTPCAPHPTCDTNNCEHRFSSSGPYIDGCRTPPARAIAASRRRLAEPWLGRAASRPGGPARSRLPGAAPARLKIFHKEMFFPCTCPSSSPFLREVEAPSGAPHHHPHFPTGRPTEDKSRHMQVVEGRPWNLQADLQRVSSRDPCQTARPRRRGAAAANAPFPRHPRSDSAAPLRSRETFNAFCLLPAAGKRSS